MSDLTDDFPPTVREAALIAADNALTAIWRHADANRAPDGSINVSTYAMAKAVIAAVEPILRADERATVAEEVAADILARLAAIGLRPTPWADGYTLASRYAAAVSRKHATRAPESHGDGREGALTSDPTPEGANAAEAPSGRSGEGSQT